MEQIRQILQQLSLNLELNIAMCDLIDDHEKRVKALEKSQEAQKVRIDSLYTQLSEMRYVAASRSYDERNKK